MYAVVKTGGKQYRVRPGEMIRVERLAVEPGDAVDLDQVLLITDGADVRVGNPVVTGATVRARVIGHERGDKVIVFKYKSKVRYRRKQGHRQNYTKLAIVGIDA